MLRRVMCEEEISKQSTRRRLAARVAALRHLSLAGISMLAFIGVTAAASRSDA
jgi:hypothetical protein